MNVAVRAPNSNGVESPGVGYWVVATLLLLWSLAYAGLVYSSFFAWSENDWSELVERGRIRAEYADYIAAIPDWVIGLTILLAVARLVGCVGLVLRRSFARHAFLLALLLTGAIMVRGFVFAGVLDVIRTSQVIVEGGFVAISVFAWIWAIFACRRGVLRPTG